MKVKQICIVKLIVLQLIIVSHLSSCKQMQKEEYEWIPTVGAPEEYPVKIISGQFLSDYGFSPQLPQSDFDNSGWGDSGGVMLVGPDKKPVPDSLHVTWLSFAENQCYKGSFALPSERIAALLKAGYVYHETNAREDFNYLTLGFSPGGHITLWITGGPAQVEVATFKAEPVKLQRKDVGPDDGYLFEPGFITDSYTRNVPAALREDIVKNGINYVKYQEWQKKYNYRFKVNDDAVKYYHLFPSYFNEESEQIFDEQLHANPLDQRAVPKSVFVVWFDKKQQKMSTEIVFDEQEIRTAFGELTAAEPGLLSFTVDPDQYTVKVSLSHGKKNHVFMNQKALTTLVSN